jgi:hypothetical protein
MAVCDLVSSSWILVCSCSHCHHNVGLHTELIHSLDMLGGCVPRTSKESAFHIALLILLTEHFERRGIFLFHKWEAKA